MINETQNELIILIKTLEDLNSIKYKYDDGQELIELCKLLQASQSKINNKIRDMEHEIEELEEANIYERVVKRAVDNNK